MPLHRAQPTVTILGDLCIDRNEACGHNLDPAWGSPALFVARQLRADYGLRPLVCGPYADDLAPLVGEFALDGGPSGRRSLAYRNVVTPSREGLADPGVQHDRSQYWRPADRARPPIRPHATWAASDLVYFCPLIPDEDRAADIEEFRGARRAGGAVQVLLAQGLMRTSGAAQTDGYRRVLRRRVTDAEAATWSCFDIVVFSDDDHHDAVAGATRWSAHPAARDTAFVVTRGYEGATLCFQGTPTPVPTRPVPDEVAPVGAGDVFAATMGVEFWEAHASQGVERAAALHRAVVRATAAATAHVRGTSVQPRTRLDA